MNKWEKETYPKKTQTSKKEKPHKLKNIFVLIADILMLILKALLAVQSVVGTRVILIRLLVLINQPVVAFVTMSFL